MNHDQVSIYAQTTMKLYRDLYIELLCTTKAAAKLGSNSMKFPSNGFDPKCSKKIPLSTLLTTSKPDFYQILYYITSVIFSKELICRDCN